MPTLLEKIEANAAKRLPLPPNRQPSQELARYKNFLKVESHRLKIMHRGGASGREICAARAAVLDVLLRYLFEAVQEAVLSTVAKPWPVTLVATGGYGRGELNPHSDIDIMFLHDGSLVVRGKPFPSLTKLTDTLLYTLWDIGLKVGHAVRSIDDCVRVANEDMQSKTSLIEARLVSGNADLFAKLQKAVVTKCVKGYEDTYIQARIEDQTTRRTKYGNSASMQEPNIKNGCGGLRDYQNLLWMAFFKYRTRSLLDLETRGLINASDRRRLEAAYDYLLRVRNELHYISTRPVDVLTKSVQPSIANSLGFTDRSPSKRLEQFMSVVYLHLRNIYLITRTLEQRLALQPQPSRLPSLRAMIRNRREKAVEQIVDGFRMLNGEIHATNNRIFREQPRRLMRVFLHAQQRGLKLHPDLAQLIQQNVSLVNREFLKDQHVHDTFQEILNQRGNVAPVLRAMHETSFLGKYIPEFGKLTCLVQHEFYHQYTADEHTLICLEKLDRIWDAQAAPYSNYTELFQGIERPFLLYLALLLHDAGKSAPGKKHSEVGADLATRIAKRLALDGATTHSLRLVIENHLVMAQISQRRDLDDPSVIRNFASLMQTPANLAMLTIHTFADSMGTSDHLWNGFKDGLLWQLHRKTMQLFSGGTEFIQAEAKQRELLEAELRRQLPASFSAEEIHAHFENLPPRYFQIHSVREIAADLTRAHRFMHLQLTEEDQALSPIVTWHNEPDRGYTSVHICTWDRAGLFAKITGSLTAAGLNILSAQIFTRQDGIILDTFYVTDARTGLLANREEREAFETILLQELTAEIDLEKLIQKQKPAKPRYQSVEGERMPTVIAFDNDTSDTRTVIDVETEDRVGLLYFISRAFSELGIDLFLAKISTEKGAAVDSFYVNEESGEKILAPERQKQVERKLRTAITALDKL